MAKMLRAVDAGKSVGVNDDAENFLLGGVGGALSRRLTRLSANASWITDQVLNPDDRNVIAISRGELTLLPFQSISKREKCWKGRAPDQCDGYVVCPRMARDRERV